MQKLKAKIRELTVRKHSVESDVITKLNAVIRGTARYFAPPFATSRWQFQKLDSWIRMRIRSMKLKRKNYNDNRKLKLGYFRRKLCLLSLEEFCGTIDTHGRAHHAATSSGSPDERSSRR